MSNFNRALIIILCVIILLSSFSFRVFADNSDTSVYVTDTGYAYHRRDCGYLRSTNKLTLRDAVERGYAPCSRCNPPIPDFEYSVIAKRAMSSSGSSSKSSSDNNSTKTSKNSVSSPITIVPIILFMTWPFWLNLIVNIPVYYKKLKSKFDIFLNIHSRRLRKSLVIVVCIVVIILTPLFIWHIFSFRSETAPIIHITHGETVISPSSACLAELHFDSPSTCNYYVFLKNKYISEDTLSFCSFGGNVNIAVPYGEYEVYIASGSFWRGKFYLFGEGTKCYKYSGKLSLSVGNSIRSITFSKASSSFNEISSLFFPRN